MARRRKRRRLNVGRIVGLVVIIAVIVVGAFFITTRLGRTSYASVNKSMGEYMVKANDNLLGKGIFEGFFLCVMLTISSEVMLFIVIVGSFTLTLFSNHFIYCSKFSPN